jgi:hypothetical protein
MPQRTPRNTPKGTSKSGTNLNLGKLTVLLPRSAGRSGDEVLVDAKGDGEVGKHPLALPRFGSALAMGFSGVTPLPRTLHTTLKYSEHVFLTGTSGALGLYVFNASSLYDPNYTGTGHQPRGFDQIMPLYDHFVVLRSRIHVAITPVTFGYVYQGGLALSSTVTNQGDWDDYAEGPKAMAGPLGYPLTSGFATPTHYRMEYSAKDFLGIPDPVTADKLQGTISANPTDNAFFHIFIQDANETDTVGAAVHVSMEYDAVFIEPLNPGQS